MESLLALETGIGAEIPRALASLARRCGGMGERGRGQDGPWFAVGPFGESEAGSPSDASSEAIWEVTVN